MRRCASVGLLDGCLRAVWRVLVLVNMLLVSPQRCSPARNRRFARPSARSAYTYTPSGPSPAQLDWFSQVPPRWRRRNKPRLHFCGSSSPVSGPRPPSRSTRRCSRALHPPSASQCFVGGTPPPCLARIRRRSPRTASPRVAQFGARPLARLPHRRSALIYFSATPLAVLGNGANKTASPLTITFDFYTPNQPHFSHFLKCCERSGWALTV